MAWNMGTITSTLSDSLMPSTDAVLTDIECKKVERWL